jgi:hypothetical protein
MGNLCWAIPAPLEEERSPADSQITQRRSSRPSTALLPWSPSTGTGGRHPPETVVAFKGNPGRHGPARASPSIAKLWCSDEAVVFLFKNLSKFDAGEVGIHWADDLYADWQAFGRLANRRNGGWQIHHCRKAGPKHLSCRRLLSTVDIDHTFPASAALVVEYGWCRSGRTKQEVILLEKLVPVALEATRERF